MGFFNYLNKKEPIAGEELVTPAIVKSITRNKEPSLGVTF